VQLLELPARAPDPECLSALTAWRKLPRRAATCLNDVDPVQTRITEVVPRVRRGAATQRAVLRESLSALTASLRAPARSAGPASSAPRISAGRLDVERARSVLLVLERGRSVVRPPRCICANAMTYAMAHSGRIGP